MKTTKKIVIAFLAITALTVGVMSFTSNYKANATTTEKECRYGQCSFYIQHRDGTLTQCKNCCQEGSTYCWSHNHQ